MERMYQILLCTSLILCSCSIEVDNIDDPFSLKENESLLLDGDSIRLDAKDTVSHIKEISYEIITNPALEWWYDQEGALGAPYIYFIYTTTEPLAYCAIDTCRNYLSIMWNGGYPYSGGYYALEYRRMQIQYKESGYGKPWLYPKFESEESDIYYGSFIVRHKKYGICNRQCLDAYQDHPMDFSSVCFPAGPIDIRIRILHDDFPGPNIGDAQYPDYNRELATEWDYFYNSVDNTYGFGISQPSYGSNGWSNNNVLDSDPDVLNVTVYTPFAQYGVTYSYTVSTGLETMSGNAFTMLAGEGSHNFSKVAKNIGMIWLNATRTETVGGYQMTKYCHKSQLYGSGDTQISFSFSDSDFF